MPGIKRKIAVSQGEGVLGGVAENLEIMREAVSEAKRADAGLVIFPELILTGYNIGEAGWELAEAADGPSAKRIVDMARSYGIAILYGYPERAGETLYNASQLIARNGDRLASYRKCQLSGAGERQLFAPGDEAIVVELEGLKLGLLICYDIEFPEAARLLALKGAELIAVASATPQPHDEIARILVPARALENQVFVAFANRCGREGELAYTGGSCVIGPDGADIARAAGEECLLIAEIDTAEIARRRAKFGYLADRRQDLYGVVVGP
jgi:predicted amidohydrolase